MTLALIQTTWEAKPCVGSEGLRLREGFRLLALSRLGMRLMLMGRAMGRRKAGVLSSGVLFSSIDRPKVVSSNLLPLSKFIVWVTKPKLFSRSTISVPSTSTFSFLAGYSPDLCLCWSRPVLLFPCMRASHPQPHDGFHFPAHALCEPFTALSSSVVSMIMGFLEPSLPAFVFSRLFVQISSIPRPMHGRSDH